MLKVHFCIHTKEKLSHSRVPIGIAIIIALSVYKVCGLELKTQQPPLHPWLRGSLVHPRCAAEGLGLLSSALGQLSPKDRKQLHCKIAVLDSNCMFLSLLGVARNQQNK